MSRRRIVVVLSASAIVTSMLVGVPSAGARIDLPVPQGAGLLAQREGPVSVMLELDAPPASRAYADAQQLSPRAAPRATRAAISRIERLQASVRGRLSTQATRATVLFETTNVYAGIAITTDADRIDAISAIPGVKAVHPLVPKEVSNFITVPLIDAPAAWVDAGVTGEGVTVGIIDTGIDYTHADFGGPGTVGAYQSALAAKDAGQSPAYPDAAKIAGGYDFAGNAYDPENADTFVPEPDDNPLDCGGHGTHVAGTTGGYGVNADGTPYDGPWSAATPFDSMGIGPGVAPQATLYALKVFGCEGSTLLVTEALDWAVDPNGDGDFSDHLDVVNMSLGASFGSPQDPDSVASNNAVDAGITVVASAGNSGDMYEVTGSPGIAAKVLSVAASDDAGQILDGFTAYIAGTPSTYPALLSDEYPWATGPGVSNATVVALGDWSQEPSASNNTDGCDSLSAADAAKAAGKVVLLYWNSNDPTRRCGSAGRSDNIATAGASGGILGSDEAMLSVGIYGSTTIPVVLTDGPSTKALSGALSDGQAVTATLNNDLKNSERIIVTGPDDPTDTLMDFTSRGSALASNAKPEITGPGGSIFSAAVATGSQGASYSGTSMAAPHVAGVAALVVDAHPTWAAWEVKAALVNSANHDLYLGDDRTGPRYDVLRGGAGRVDAKQAVDSHTIAYASETGESSGAVNVSFGVLNVKKATQTSKTVVFSDKRTSGGAVAYAVTFDSINALPGATYTVSPRTVTLRPGMTADVTVTLALDPTKLVHAADPTIVLDPFGIGILRDFLTDASGVLIASPSDDSPDVRVAVFAAPRPASAISGGKSVSVSGSGDTKRGALTLRGQAVYNTGDLPYEKEVSRVSAMQLVGESSQLPPCEPGISSGCVASEDQSAADLRYLGFTSDARLVTSGGGDPLSPASPGYMYFGFSTWGAWRTASDIAQFVVYLDTDNDGIPDAVLYNYRVAETDIFTAEVVSVRPGDELATVGFELVNNVAGDKDTAKMHSNVMSLPVSLADLANPIDAAGGALAPFIATGQTTISYWVETYAADGTVIDVIAHPRVPLRVDVAKPPLTAFDSTGSMPTRATSGRSLKVELHSASAGANPRLLLLHHLNVLAKKAEVIPVVG